MSSKQAINCRFQVECKEVHTDHPPNHQVYVSYKDEIIRHVIIAGLYHMEIRREIFGSDNLDTISVNDLVGLIEGKEMARDATSGTTAVQPVANAVSQFQQRKKGDSTKPYLTLAQAGGGLSYLIFPFVFKM